MRGELVRAIALVGSMTLVGGTLVGVVRALLGRSSWASLALPGIACVALLAFIVWVLRPAEKPERDSIS